MPKGRTTFVRGNDQAPPLKVSFGEQTHRSSVPRIQQRSCSSDRAGNSNNVRSLSGIRPRSSSIVGGRASSIIGGRISGAMGFQEAPYKDTRDIKSAKFKRDAVKDIVALLVETGACVDIKATSLQNPSTKDVYTIFEHLKRYLLPEDVSDPTLKNDEYFVSVVKAMGYPVVFNKQHMASMGAPHSWPHVLGALDFMRRLVWEANMGGGLISFLRYVLLSDRDGDFHDEQEPLRLRRFNTLYNSYLAYLRDCAQISEARVRQLMNMGLHGTEADCKASSLRQTLQNMKDELEMLRKKPDPYELAQKEFMEQSNTLEKLTQQQREKREQYSRLTAASQIARDQKESNRQLLQSASEEVPRLRNIISLQKMKPAEVDHMRSMIINNRSRVDALESTVQPLARTVGEREIEVASSLSTVQREYDRLNTYMASLRLITDVNRTMELRAEFNKDPNHVRKTVLSQLHERRLSSTSNFADLREALVQEGISLEQVRQQLSSCRKECESLKSEIEQHSIQCEKQRHTATVHNHARKMKHSQVQEQYSTLLRGLEQLREAVAQAENRNRTACEQCEEEKIRNKELCEMEPARRMQLEADLLRCFDEMKSDYTVRMNKVRESNRAVKSMREDVMDYVYQEEKWLSKAGFVLPHEDISQESMEELVAQSKQRLEQLTEQHNEKKKYCDEAKKQMAAVDLYSKATGVSWDTDLPEDQFACAVYTEGEPLALIEGTAESVGEKFWQHLEKLYQ